MYSGLHKVTCEQPSCRSRYSKQADSLAVRVSDKLTKGRHSNLSTDTALLHGRTVRQQPILYDLSPRYSSPHDGRSIRSVQEIRARVVQIVDAEDAESEDGRGHEDSGELFV